MAPSPSPNDTSSTNDFCILLNDLAEFLNFTPEQLRKTMKTMGLHPFIFRQRAYLLPEVVREIFTKYHYTFEPQTVSIQMLKGGVGKTTTVMNLGIRANMYGVRVLLVDLDQQANLSYAFGVNGQDRPVWVDLLEGREKIEDLIVEISPHLHLIPSNLNNSVLDRILLNGRRNIATAVSQYLESVRERFDLILFDTAPSLNAINTAAACASDKILLPVNPDRFSVSGLEKTLEELESIRRDFVARFRPHILFTRYDGRESASQSLLAECAQSYGNQMMKSFVRTSSDLKNVIGTKKNIFQQKSNSKEDYDLVTRELLSLNVST